MEIEEELGADKSTELGSNDTEEMVNVLTSMEATNILTSGGAAASVSPGDVLPTVGVPTVSESFPTGVPTPIRSPIIGAKDKGKEKAVESEVPKKTKLQEQIDAQELNIMIEGLDRSNEVIVKHLREYEQAEADLSIGEKLELISELVKYQDHRAKILKYQAQQSKPLSKKEQREFYMSVLRSHAGWKTKHFRRMTSEQIKEKFILIWKLFEDFIPMSSKEESERVKIQGLKIDQGSSKRMRPLKVKHPIIDWEIYSEGKREYWKIIRLGEKELWVELKRVFEPDFEDQLWTHHQAFMHDPLDWKLYDTCGVHHVSTKDQEIFILVEKDYPLRKGLTTVMIKITQCNNHLDIRGRRSYLIQFPQVVSELALAQVESRLVKHKDRELKYSEKIRILEFNTESSADCIESLKKKLKVIKNEKEGLKSKLTAQLYSPPMKDMSWTGLLEFVDDTVTDYIRPAPTVESSLDDAQNRNPSVTATEASHGIITSKPAIKFVKASERPTTDKAKTTKKPAVKYAKLYRKTTKRSTIRGNQRNWNNFKSQQLGENFVMKNKACFNYGHFDHLSYNCGLGVKMGRSSPKNNYTHRSMPPRPAIHRPYRPPMRPVRSNMNTA
uniref:Ubiquitin hydrolase n=1 Tax=Tanacetum cinerariifolium TaxID=118510 RepID=A0A6L2M0L8_TANCI|nr:ubiquitin hydrolase [Tanacetum cinerariifolium]